MGNRQRGSHVAAARRPTKFASPDAPERRRGPRRGRRALAAGPLGVLLALALLLVSHPARAYHPGFAPCPTETPPSSNPPSSVVVVSILSIDPNSDLEGDDDNVPFYDNHADIYGRVIIDGEVFSLPEISENDFPHWDGNGVFRKPVSGGPVHISIKVKESDGGLTGDDDNVDISPVAGKDSLDIDYDLCSLRISGDIGSVTPGDDLGQTQNVIVTSGGSAGSAATIRFKIELEDGRPVTASDLALVDVDFVQVVLHQANIVAGKPTILRVRLASNYAAPVTSTLRVFILGGISVDQAFPVTIGPGEVQQLDLFTDSPLVFPESGAPYTPFVRIAVEEPTSIPPGDCRNDNNEFVSGSEPIPFSGIANGAEVFWQVVPTRTQGLLWAPVGALLDIANCASDEDVDEIRDLGTAFIEATYPVADVDNSTSPVCIIAPGSAAIDFMVTVLAAFGIPADALLPFGLVFELGETAGLVNTIPGFPCDRVMGVLPNNWFDRFIYDLWVDVTGLSLGEFAPHAVILLASSDGDPMLTLPAHELGHTYGLSSDSDIKPWVCGQDFPGDIDVLACGALGGFDEYKSESPVAGMQDGKPSNGYWIRQGGEPASIPDAVFGEQCNSHCLMGSGPVNAQDSWGVDRRWIDTADYDQLLRKLSRAPLLAAPKFEPAVPGDAIFVSGMIAWDDRLYLGEWYRASGVTPDRDDPFGLYLFRFVGSGGNTLHEVGLPVNWTTPDVNGGLPITFFGLYLPFPPGTERIEIWNRKTNHLLGTREVSANAPEVQIVSPAPGQVVDAGCETLIEWQARDADGNSLTFTVLLRPAGQNGWPVATHLTAHQHRLDTSALLPGVYEVMVLAADGVHVGKSLPVSFTVQAGTGTDTTPPTIVVSLDPEVLWPPNHKMVGITATVRVLDNCDLEPDFVLTSITSDEPDNGTGDGNTVGDIQGANFGTADVEFELRAERAGGGDGRTYTVTYTATDASGNTATAVASVTVPHDQGVPSKTMLHGIQPNPFNPTATVSFDLAAEGMTRVQVFDLRGALVRTLVERTLPAGRHEAIWRGEDEKGRPVSSGVYIFRLVTGDGMQTRKAVLVR